MKKGMNPTNLQFIMQLFGLKTLVVQSIEARTS